MLNKLSEELKIAREASGITIQQLAAKTRVDLKFIVAMEDGNFSFLPELYVKAFLKEYVKFVGLDEKLILKKYEFAKQGKEYIEPPQETLTDKIKEIKEDRLDKETHSQPKSIITYIPSVNEELNRPPAPAPDRRNLIFIGVAVGLILIVALIYLIFIRKSDEIVVSDKSVEELVQESKQRYVEDVPKNPALDSLSKSVNSTDNLRLSISASDTCWVNARLDDSRQDEFKLLPHTNKIITAKSNFKVRFGNSFHVQLLLNNNPLSFNAKSRTSYVYIDTAGLRFIDSPAKQIIKKNVDTNPKKN
jgi:cytoskeletal protein RodZ